MPVRDRTPWWWNLPLPGAGLIVDGRLGLGLAAALPGLFALTLALVAALLATAEARPRLVGGCAAAYAALAVAAAVTHALATRRRPLDEALVRRLHAEAAAAWLRDEHPAAVASATRLCAAAPAEAGAWRLLALAADAAGDAALTTRARRRADRLEAEAAR